MVFYAHKLVELFVGEPRESNTEGGLFPGIFGTVMLGAFALSWRTATVVMTVLGLVYAAVFFWLFRSSPKTHPWANEAEAKLITEFDASAEATGARLSRYH